MRKASKRLFVLGLMTLAAALGATGADAKDGAPQRTLEFSWPAVDRAKSYELKFTPNGKNADDLDPIFVTSQNSAWKGKLPAGSYQLKMRTIDRRGVPGPWGAGKDLVLPLPAVEPVSPSVNATLKTKDTDKTKVVLKWKSLGEDVVYRVDVKNAKGKLVVGDDTDDTQLTVEVPVSQAFSWVVTAKGADGTPSEPWAAARQFKVLGGRLSQPEITVPFEPEAPLVKWSKPPNTSTYAIKLTVLDEKTGKWKQLLDDKAYKKNDLKMAESWPEGQYRLLVSAQGPLRDSSISTIYDFETGVRAQLKGKKKSAHRIQGGYAFAPTLRTIAMKGETSGVSFNAPTANSHVIGGAYRYLFFPHAIGFNLSMHLIRGKIFDDDSTKETLPDQDPLQLNSTNIRFLTTYEIILWRLALGLNAGADNHALHVLYADSLSSFDIETIKMTDLLVGPSLDFVLGSSSSIGAGFLVGRAMGASMAENYARSILELRFVQRLWSDQLALTLAGIQDTMSFQFASPATQEIYQTAWIHRTFSAGLSYVF